MKKPCYPIIAGPTASGKSALAVEFAKQTNGEVVSVDSMQIYDTVIVGTARPTAEEMQGVPHHMVGVVPLCTSYSVAQYVKDANKAIDKITQNGHLPILCGGTGLYLQSLIENITFEQEASADYALRDALKNRFAKEGGIALLQELSQFDPITAAKLHPNDAGRIIRALEVYHTTGKPISTQVADSHNQEAAFDTCLMVLDFHDREKLYDRIHRRVDLMVQNGLLDEAKTLLSYPKTPTVIQAIGYKELRPYFEGTLTLDEALDNLKKSTRHYAKRQLSWFRRMPNVQFLYVDDYLSLQDLTNAALKIWQENIQEGVTV